MNKHKGSFKEVVKGIECIIYKFILKRTGKVVFLDSETMESISGDYIGDLSFSRGRIKFFLKHGIDYGTIASPYTNSTVCAIAFSPKEQKWYGWSHRAVCGFGIGHIVEEGDSSTSSGFIPEYEKEHPEENKSVPVGFEVKNLKDAKRVAIAFALSVS